MRRMSEPQSSPLEQTIAIVGVGLIGGSLAAAIRQRKLARKIIGVGRNAARIEMARTSGLIDVASTDLTVVAPQADVMVFCTPVDQVAEGVRLAAGHARPECLLTDAGSVKQPICEDLADIHNFIGSHPIAGSHRQGFEAADGDLFNARTCVLTPGPEVSMPLLTRLDLFWRSVGMRTVNMTPADHDRALAMTSHLPHVAASALAGTLSDQYRSLTGSGFRDSTRIAAGDPELWCGILLQNGGPIIAGIDRLQQQLAAFRHAIANRDSAGIQQLLVSGQQNRLSLDKPY